jgi:hypothetical protein
MTEMTDEQAAAGWEAVKAADDFDAALTEWICDLPEDRALQVLSALAGRQVTAADLEATEPLSAEEEEMARNLKFVRPD